jgi:hypothetical protein
MFCRALIPAAAVVFAAALSFWLRTSPAPPRALTPTTEENGFELRVMFGLKRAGPAEWDNRISLSQGRVRALDGAQVQRPDKITGPDSWKCAVRVGRYADSLPPRGANPMESGVNQAIANGIVAMVSAPSAASVEISTARGRFSFLLEQLSPGKPLFLLDGDAAVGLRPPSIPLPKQEGQCDNPAMLAARNGDVWTSWIAYRERADHVWVTRRTGRGWEEPVRMTDSDPADNFRIALGEDAKGCIWSIWSGKTGGASSTPPGRARLWPNSSIVTRALFRARAMTTSAWSRPTTSLPGPTRSG